MKTNKILLISALSLATTLFVACDNDDDLFKVVETVPAYTVSAPQIQDASTTYVSLSATFKGRSDARYTKAGYCYTIEALPTIYDNAVEGTVTGNVVTATITGLELNKIYTFRAFVVEYAGDVIYSEPIEVVTGEGALSESLARYKAPQYNDYYIDFAGWDQRAAWNLANVHDPTVMLADDGYYYMYQTDAGYGNPHDGHGHFFGRRSKDLVNWEYLGATMSSLPEWIAAKCNEIRATQGLDPITLGEADCGYWAPVARNLGNGTYRMYYSVVLPGAIEPGSKNGKEAWGERGFIGMMETTDPSSNNWIDKGYVICSSTDHANNYWCSGDWANAYYRYNAIDPSYIVTPEGEHWLIYGSWHSGIAAVQVDAATGMPVKELGSPVGNSLADIADYGTCIYTRKKNNRWQASEGPEIVYRDGYYYLFLAYDALDVPYNTRVVRSTSVTGPYVGIDGTDVTNVGGDAFPIVTHPYKFQGDQGWVGISHCAVFDDGNDNWYYASQGRMPAGAYGNEFANAIMLGHVRSILWTPDGWPVVLPERYGAVPQAKISADDLVGAWEHIDLSYNYGVQDESVAMTLGAGIVSDGKWKGSEWSFDPETNILTIGSQQLMVARECDWEAQPRTHTIVYAGINGRTTFWGKKVVK
ncbi:MAG: arabinan endo-1,5-alpha-L-arabinosidase [Muribaculaceae bacterium]|nr:arabinan endo-1,5-alpha-L-arabinosidase [Muribaculaceae bacterium]